MASSFWRYLFQILVAAFNFATVAMICFSVFSGEILTARAAGPWSADAAIFGVLLFGVNAVSALMGCQREREAL